MSKNLDDCKILDATCGSRTIWFTKDNPNCLYIDSEWNTEREFGNLPKTIARGE